MEKVAIGLALAIYAALLAYVIPRHEPWADEAQAWELASTLSLKSLFGTYIHYEGSPGAWHAILWCFSRMHGTYTGMHWMAATIALGAMAVLTIAAPFPLLLRLLLPFTYFFIFQYAVVARSYVLFPSLLFMLACFWRRRFEQLLPVTLLLGLLANVSAHGLAVASGLTLTLAIELTRLHLQARAHPKYQLANALLLIAMMGFAAWCIIPAPQAGWVSIAKQMVAVAPASTGSKGSYLGAHLLSFLIGTADAGVYGLCIAFGHGLATKFKLGLLIWGLLVWVWKRESLLRYVLPVPFLVVLCRPITSQFYHAGLVWVLFVFLWWITWPDLTGEQPQTEATHSDWRRKALLIAVCVSVAIQLSWGLQAIRYDATMQYSPDREGAAILQAYINRGDRVVVAIPSRRDGTAISQYFVTGMQPYFEVQPISNMPFRFWFWGGDDDLRTKYLSDSASRSAIVVVEETSWDPRYHIEEKRLTSIGYQRRHAVCAQVFYPMMKNPPLCHVFYDPEKQ